MPPMTEYELRQVAEIALWKSERPSLLSDAFRGASRPFTRLFTKVVPGRAVRAILDRVEALAEKHDSLAAFLRETGLAEIESLRDADLETCDRLAARQCAQAEERALLEGIAPAVGGVVIPGIGGEAAAVFDVPILFEAALRAIRRIGHCYGYRLDTEADRRYVLSILDLANADAPAARQLEREQIDHPAGRDVSLNGVAGAVVDDLPLEAIPIVGELSSIFLDYGFLRRVDITARRVFQERWLRDRGKVGPIPPAAVSRRRSSTEGVVDVLAEATYTGTFALGFGVTFPALLASSLAARLPLGAVGAGIRDGARRGAGDADKVASEMRHGARDVLRAATAPAPTPAVG